MEGGRRATPRPQAPVRRYVAAHDGAHGGACVRCAYRSMRRRGSRAAAPRPVPVAHVQREVQRCERREPIPASRLLQQVAEPTCSSCVRGVPRSACLLRASRGSARACCLPGSSEYTYSGRRRGPMARADVEWDVPGSSEWTGRSRPRIAPSRTTSKAASAHGGSSKPSAARCLQRGHTHGNGLASHTGTDECHAGPSELVHALWIVAVRSKRQIARLVECQIRRATIVRRA